MSKIFFIDEVKALVDSYVAKKITISKLTERLNEIASVPDEMPETYEPYFGWCNVEECENEGANGGCCWSETGYWTVCSKHASDYREGLPQPQMKQSAIDREKKRGADGVLVL